MTHLSTDYTRAVLAELATHGVTEYDIEDGRKHRKLRFIFGGKPILYVMPKSPSDWRASLNAVSDLRRIMGVDRLVVKNAERRANPKARAAPRDTAGPDSFTPMHDGLAALAHFQPGPVSKALQDRIDLACYRLSFFKGTFAAWKRQAKRL